MWSRIKRTFIKGLATLLPTILTIYLFFWVFGFVRTNISEPINSFVGGQLYATEWGRGYLYDKFEIPFQDDSGKPLEGEALAKELRAKLPWWPGFVIAFVAVLGVGFFIASWLGRGLFKTGEGLIARIPVVKVIYPYAKQVTDFIFKEKEKDKFTQVVAVEYPRKGLYSMGFLTGGGFKTVSRGAGRRLINVFIPSSPTPITGYVIFVSEDDIIELPITVDEALRFAVSGGVLVPSREVQKGTAVDFRSGRVAGVPGGGDKK